jgi:hypothetical protein
MEKVNHLKEHEILQEIAVLLDNTAIEPLAEVQPTSFDDEVFLERMLMNLKAINVRYDKHEALVHIARLMEKYNIQLDEVLDYTKS